MGIFSSLKTTATHIADAYTRSDVPGKTIENSIGLIQYTKKIKNPYELAMNVEKAFESLVDLAKKKGANAVVNVRMEISSAGSEIDTMHIFIVAYGEAVVLA